MTDLRSGETWPDYLRRKEQERICRLYRDIASSFDKLRRTLRHD